MALTKLRPPAAPRIFMTPPTIDIAAAYDRYHGTGFYARRYPAPNRACLELLKGLIAAHGDRVLDFGCGDGRYAAPLLEETSARVLGYDISRVAIDELSVRCASYAAAGRLTLIAGDLDALTQSAGRQAFDIAIAMFGVLAHVPTRAGRIKALTILRGLLRPGGRLVVTAPNALRRFRAEQAAARPMVASCALEAGDVLYARESDGVRLDLYYHLYQPGELEDEMRQAGFRPVLTTAESVLPERGVVTWAALGLLDRILRKAAPVSLAYGFLTVAAPDECA